jgi:hypothetical protein
MPFCHVSWDIKLAAIRLYEHDLLPLKDILDCVGFLQCTFDHIHALWVRTGDVVKHKFGTQGCPRTLKFDNVDYLLWLIHQHPDWFLNELQFLLQTNHFIAIHYITIYWTLLHAGVSLKKLKEVTSEHNKEKWNAFTNHMAMYDPDELGFLDETSKNKKTAAQIYSHLKKGRQAVMKQHFVHGHYLIATALLTVEGVAVSKVVKESMIRDLYLKFLEQDVVCLLPFLYNIPFDIHSFHCALRILVHWAFL